MEFTDDLCDGCGRLFPIDELMAASSADDEYDDAEFLACKDCLIDPEDGWAN